MKRVSLEHHDLSASVGKQFLSDINIFLGAKDDLCNPFSGESFDLYYPDAKVVIEEIITAELMQVEDEKKQRLEFVETRLHQTTCAITNTICKNNFKFFRTIKAPSLKKQEKLEKVKDNVALLSLMYISCQTKEGNLKNFFSHENQA